MIFANGQPGQPGWRILIAGTGGQGVLTAARLLCDTLVAQGRQVVSGQLHGMAQRGGAVQSSVLIDCGISPVMGGGRAGFVLGFEPVETARALPFMSSRTVVFMNTAPVVPYVLAQRAALDQQDAQYPDVERLAASIRAVTTHLFLLDATRCATEAGSSRAMNMFMLGCFLGSGSLPCTGHDFWDTASNRMPAALAEINKRAFLRGVEAGKRLGPDQGTP